MSKAQLVVDAKNRLGESAMWHPREQTLYWVDVRAPAVYRLEDNGSVTTFPLPALAGGLVPRQSGGLAIALQNGFHTIDTRRPKPSASSPTPSPTCPTTASTTAAATAWAASGPAPST